MKRRCLILLGLLVLQPVQAGLLGDARGIHKGIQAKSSDVAHGDALQAIEAGRDAEAVANLAQSLGVSVDYLVESSARNFPGSAWRDVRQQVRTEAGQYDRSFDAASSNLQQRTGDAVQAEALYRYALTLRNLAERRQVLTQAAQMGNQDAAMELRFY